MSKTPKEEKIDIISEELSKFSKLEALALSEGGQILFKSLMADVSSGIDTLINRYSSLTQLEFISICADIKTKLDLARILKKSEKNKDQAKSDLEEALLEN
jgi:hypothetical protein